MRSRGQLIVVGVIVGTALAAYRFLLTDDARENLRSAVTTVVDGYGKVSDALGIHRSYAGEGETLSHNRERLRQEWEDLGF